MRQDIANETGRIHILITDDEEDFLGLLKEELTELDEHFQVFVANSGYQALGILQSEEIHLLLTDIAMNDMDGYELYSRVKDIRPDMPIIMMTGFGYDPNHTVVNAKKVGLRDILFKPFEVSKLLALIYESLKRNEK